METKICTKCKIEKPISDYGIVRNRSYKFNSKCKQCNNIQSKTYYQSNKEKHKKAVYDYK